MKNFKLFIGIAAMAAVLTTSCGPDPIEVLSIELDQTILILEIGQTQSLNATVLPDDATDKSVAWTSSNPAVASVANGDVTAKTVGTAIISAKAGNQIATCTVTVLAEIINVESITLDAAKLTLAIDAEHTLAAVVLPVDASDPRITWTSNNTDVATVTNGVVKAVAVGNATVTAKAGDVTAICEVTVYDQYNDAGVVINGVKWATRNVNESKTFTAYPEDYGKYYSWSDAQNACPTGWRVPTPEELGKLSGVSKTKEILNNIKGMRFTDAGNSIFLPAAGYRVGSNGNINDKNVQGSFWSSTASGGDATSYYFLYENANWLQNQNTPKDNGQSVRCVQ